MVFVGLNHDFVPYSPRDPSSLKGNIANHGVKPEELAETELKIREEVSKDVMLLSYAPFRFTSPGGCWGRGSDVNFSELCEL